MNEIFLFLIYLIPGIFLFLIFYVGHPVGRKIQKKKIKDNKMTHEQFKEYDDLIFFMKKKIMPPVMTIYFIYIGYIVFL